MIDCVNHEIRDVLPEFVHGRLAEAERARIEAHVLECAACAAEIELIRKAANVIALGAPRVDTDRIAAAVDPRVGLPEIQTIGGKRRRWPLGLAAAVMVAAASIGVVQLADRDRAGDAESVASAPVNGAESGLVLVGGIESLTTDQLATLVAGVETLSPILDFEGDLFVLTSDIR